MRDQRADAQPAGFGIAGGRIAGTVRLDGNKEPMRGDIKMRVQNLQLAKLFPTVKQAQDSKGDLNGLIELTGSGDSVGKLLGSSNGKIGVYMDEGKVSRFLMELVALDLWDVARIKLRGDEDIEIRCAIADFNVKGGMAQTNAFVFDTTVTNVSGSGSINLKTEEMDITLKPQPKDRGIGSLRTPLHIKGTFGEPKVGPDMGKLAARGGGALAIGILNPLLAILPLIEDGKGKDSNCSQLIAEAGKSTRGDKAATARAAKAAQRATPRRRSAEADGGEEAYFFRPIVCIRRDRSEKPFARRALSPRRYFFSPIVCIRRDSSASSFAINALNSSAEANAGRTPTFSAALTNSADATVVRIAVSIWEMTGRGVPRGTAMPRQASSATSKPSSRAVGT